MESLKLLSRTIDLSKLKWAEILDSNEENQGFVSNLQERIIVQETVLARGRAEHTTKSKLLVLPIDPTTGRNFTCHNFHWQGTTHTDTSIGEVYRRAYKSVIPIKVDEIQEGGGFDEGEKVNPDSYQGSRYYKSYIVPISGQDGKKLAKKPVVKEVMKLKTKADRALEMLNTMQGGVSQKWISVLLCNYFCHCGFCVATIICFAY